MPGPKRVKDETVLAAITGWRGDVKNAAVELGIQRANLYKRLDLLGIGRAELRLLRTGSGQARAVLRGDMGVIEVSPVSSVSSLSRVSLEDGESPAARVSRVQDRSGASFPATAGGSTFRGVQAALKDEELPIPPTRERPKAPKLKPPNVDAFHADLIELMARYRRRFEADTVFNQFFESEWPKWIAQMLGREEPARKAKRGGAE